MSKQVLINVEDKDIRVAVLEDGQLNQLFVEQKEDKSVVGNIYKGRIDSIVPGLKALFVNVGLERNTFLHFSDVRPEYSLPDRGAPQRAGRQPKANAIDAPTGPTGEDHTVKAVGKLSKRSIPLKIGDEILVQVTKEGIDEKGARVTTYISLPGRYLVFLPYTEKEGGVSRRIEDSSERERLRALLRSLKADEGSFIIRTAGLNQEEQYISADVKKLQKIWQHICRDGAAERAPILIHDEHEILARLVRDEISEEIDEILVDSKDCAAKLRTILTTLLPSLKKKVLFFNEPDENIFDKYGVEAQFQKALRRKVWLKSGGYIIIDETEALVAIDVNTGKFVGKEDQETTILQTNLEAAETVAQQIRLRDLGGIIVIDFIDMRTRENQHKVLKRFKELLKLDRAKTTVVPLTEYGLMQMTRKRVRHSLSRVIFKECPICQGSGQVLSESQIWKNIKYEILHALVAQPKIKSLQITVHPDIRAYLENGLLDAARLIANRKKVGLSFVDNKEYHLEQFNILTLEESTKKAPAAAAPAPSRRSPQKKQEKTLEKTEPVEG